MIRWKTWATMGALYRREFERHLRGACHILDITLDLQESRGWLDSTYYITITGETEKVRIVQEWFRQMERLFSVGVDAEEALE